MPETAPIPWVDQIIATLLNVNIAIPIIFTTVANMAAIIKSLTGAGPTLAEIADALDVHIAANDTTGQAEIARLRALLGM